MELGDLLEAHRETDGGVVVVELGTEEMATRKGGRRRLRHGKLSRWRCLALLEWERVRAGRWQDFVAVRGHRALALYT